MSVFIGLSIQGTLNATTYSLALSQIQHYTLQTPFCLTPHPTLLLLHHNSQCFTLPKNPLYLYTCLQHIIVNSQEDQQFLQTIVQCLLIVKQHCMYRVEIEMVSQLDIVYNLRKQIEEQVPRRMLTHLRVLHQGCRDGVGQEDVHMLVANLGEEFHREYRVKIKVLSLRVLAEGQIEAECWKKLSKEEIALVDGIVNDPYFQKLAMEVLERIVRCNEYKLYPEEQSLIEGKQNIMPNQPRESRKQIQTYSGNVDSKTALFQLKQSLNMARLAWIIESADFAAMEQKMLGKFDRRVKDVAQRLIAGGYGNEGKSREQEKKLVSALLGYENRRGCLNWQSITEQLQTKLEPKDTTTKRLKTSFKSSPSSNVHSAAYTKKN